MAQEPLFNRYHTDAKGNIKAVPVDIGYLNSEVSTAKGSFGGQIGRKFEDYDGNISVKSSYDRSDYEWFRANTSSLTILEQMRVSQKAYEKVGMVRNIIDMMGDFTAQGIRIEHVHPKKERFLQDWFEYVNGPAISERFVNLLYRLGNVPVQSAFGKVNVRVEEEMGQSKGEFDTTEFKKVEVVNREIPLKYTFIPPWEIEVIGGGLSLFLDKPLYAIRIPTTIRSELAKVGMTGNDFLRKEALEAYEKIKPYIDKNNKYLALPDKTFNMYFYKKDDWQVWSLPMIAAILDDLIMLERMKLADMSALDGAISNIRLWRVGIIDPSNINNSIIPTKAGINRIKHILANGVGGGTMDLVTGPEVDFKESNTQVHKFLGGEKYEKILDAIYDGMGIPPPLRSSNSSGGNATNNYISLKTLIEKLEYGRSVLTSFWNKQLEIIQKALGHKYPGKVVFDNIVLSDETAEKRLLVDLVDRDIISAEAVKYYCGFDPGLENAKIANEHKDRKSKRMPPKASPYHNPEKAFAYKKLFAQNGEVTPSQLGIELEQSKETEQPRIDILHEQNVERDKIKNKAQQQAQEQKLAGVAGRPPSVTETKKRKKKPNFRPQTGKGYEDLILWTTSAYQYISDTLSDGILKSYGKSNFRQLTNQETKDVEEFKFNVLSQLEPWSELTSVELYMAVQNTDIVKGEIRELYEELKQKYIGLNNKEPNINEERQIRIMSYARANFEEISDFSV